MTLHHRHYVSTVWYENCTGCTASCCCPRLTCMGLALPSITRVTRNHPACLCVIFKTVQRNFGAVESRWTSVRESSHVVTESPRLSAFTSSPLPRVQALLFVYFPAVPLVLTVDQFCLLPSCEHYFCLVHLTLTLLLLFLFKVLTYLEDSERSPKLDVLI